MSTPQGHVVGSTIPSWGHIKSLCALVGKMMHSRPVHATIFIPVAFYEKALKEIETKFIPGKEDGLKSLVRIVGLAMGPTPFDFDELAKNFLQQYRKLFKGEPLQHLPDSNEAFDVITPPQLLIIDLFASSLFDHIRALDVEKIPIYLFETAAAGAMIYYHGPESLGGHEKLGEKLQKIEAENDGERYQKIISAFRRCDGNLISLPGIPPMYDYEFKPQEPIMEVIPYIAPIFAVVPRTLSKCDGVILGATDIIEGPAINAIRQWLSDKPVFSIGLVDYPLFEGQADTSPETLKMLRFLDSTLEKNGPRSLLYIAFGSIFFFKKPDLFYSILDLLIEKKVPFILSAASRFMNFPGDMLERINNTGFAYCSTWVPQTDILKHEVCGWFMTHCGQNSVSESLSAGIPMICCPFDSDQPINAVNLTNNFDAAYEVFELRSGYGLRPIHRLGNRSPQATMESARQELSDLLAKAFGEDGKKKRDNIQKLQKQIKEIWAPGGHSWKEIERCMEVLH